jgi:hypothetical protein
MARIRQRLCEVSLGNAVFATVVGNPVAQLRHLATCGSELPAQADVIDVDDPQVVLRADPTAVEAGAVPEVRGAPAVANQFAERAAETVPTLVAETPGTVWAITSTAPRAAFRFTISNAKIVHIDLVFDPLKLRQLDPASPDR